MRVAQAARATSIRRRYTRVVAAVIEQFWQATVMCQVTRGEQCPSAQVVRTS